MTHLYRHLRDTGMMQSNRLQAATQRQQIYGGSLDTTLLELELVTPAELQGLLASATGLNAAPEHLLRPRSDRPADTVPADLANSGWALPLAYEDGRTFVAVHPDLPDEKLGQLYRSVHRVVPLVTPECVMARLAAERAGSVIPQRFAVLSVRFLESLAGSGPVPSEPEPQRSPTMPIDMRPPATTSRNAAGPLEIGPTSSHSLAPGAPVEPPAARTSAPVELPPTKARSVAPLDPPPAFASTPDATSRLDARHEATPAPDHEVDDATLSEIVATGRHELSISTHRDNVTASLARATLRVFPRVALFAVRKGRLRGLPVPAGHLRSLEGTEVPVAEHSDLAAIVGGRDRPLEVVEPTLRASVGLSEPVPCLTLPVMVRGRSVMLLYADRAGRPIAPSERAAVAALGEAAGHALEQVVLRQRGTGPTASPTADPVPLTTPVQPTPPPVRVETPQQARLPALVRGVTFEPPEPDQPDPNPVLRPSSEKIVVDDPAAPTWTPAVTTVETNAAVTLSPPPSPASQQTETRMSPHPRFVPPPEEQTGNGIISLSSPLDTGTSRGRIELDDEDRANEPSTPDEDAVQRQADDAVDRVEREGGSLSTIRELGEAGLLRLAARFPGPLEVFRRDLNSLPPPSAHGPLIRACIRIGPDMALHLVESMDHPNPDVRFYAAFVFQELRDDRCVKPLAKLAFDASGDVRVISMRVLETYSRSSPFPSAAKKVRAGLVAANRTRQLQAARAVGTLRDVDSVAELIELLASRDRFIQEAALESLCSVTGQQHGLKPHRWRSWFEEHENRHRIEWIIDSLRHKDVAVRRWASDELGRITNHRVVASPTGDRKEQATCVREWHQWWKDTGHEKYTRPRL